MRKPRTMGDFRHHSGQCHQRDFEKEVVARKNSKATSGNETFSSLVSACCGFQVGLGLTQASLLGHVSPIHGGLTRLFGVDLMLGSPHALLAGQVPMRFGWGSLGGVLGGERGLGILSWVMTKSPREVAQHVGAPWEPALTLPGQSKSGC